MFKKNWEWELLPFTYITEKKHLRSQSKLYFCYIVIYIKAKECQMQYAWNINNFHRENNKIFNHLR